MKKVARGARSFACGTYRETRLMRHGDHYPEECTTELDLVLSGADELVITILFERRCQKCCFADSGADPAESSFVPEGSKQSSRSILSAKHVT